MVLAGAALVPAAPLLVPEITPELPPELRAVRTALRQALGRVPHSGVTVLLAATGGEAGVHTSAHVQLAGMGRPDVAADPPVPARAVREVAAATGLSRVAGPLPLELAVLALHADRPVLPISVEAGASGRVLAELGRAIAADGGDASPGLTLVAAGDGSAGLTEGAPRAVIDGSAAWQEAYETAVGDVGLLSDLGPEEAERVAARGWAPAVVLSAACAEAGLRLRTIARAAPRGVGYLVAEALS